MGDKLMIGLSGLMALRRHVDTLANNVANQTTSGFKAQRTQFREYLTAAKEGEAPSYEKRSLVDTSHFTDFSTGGLRATGNPLDVAITDDAFFVVDTPAGRRYTRSGAFTLDDTGKLVTLDGLPVVTSTGQIVVQPRDGAVSIGSDGTVSTAKGRIAGLRLVTFADRRQLQPEGSGLFSSVSSPVDVPSGKGRLAIGVLETANVNPADEVSRLMAATRAYDVMANAVFKGDPPEELRKLAGDI